MSKKHIQASGALFQVVQLAGVFGDSKTFPDCLPKKDPDLLLDEFKVLLEEFVRESFELPEEAGKSGGIAEAGSMEEHIDNLWELLKREPDGEASPFGTRIGLPYPYVVPGGRFREIYYWDSYFTAQGLVASQHTDLLESMIQNFAYLIEQYGHIPNGNRTYFVSRSQPPFFCSMLQLLERERGAEGGAEGGIEAVTPYLAALEREYLYWMAGKTELCAGGQTASKKTVMVEEGVVLNRYWDERNVPREESFREDVELFEQVSRGSPSRQADLYRHIRAAAESGWDFSTRWLGKDRQMTSIRTTEIIPVDLNCLLFNVERQLAKWLGQMKAPRAAEYARAAAQRQAAILKYCWNEEQGWFFDYCWREGQQTDVWSLAGAYPLFCQLANDSQASQVAQQIETDFLKAGGVVSTLIESRQQWDYPNGWAPLQWITVQGLLHYQHHDLAREIAQRFVQLAENVYQRTGKMMEKYNVCDLNLDAGGGEYALQDGFGWTNGVVKAFLHM